MRDSVKYIGNFLWNIALLYLLYFLTRLIFVFDNWETFNYLTFSDLLRLCRGGLLFDTAAIAYANILYVLLVFFPFHLKEKRGYHKFVKIGTRTFIADGIIFISTSRPVSNQSPSA